MASASLGVDKRVRAKISFFFGIPAFFKALNSLTAGIKSSRLAPVG
jgi:hypothetical protein